MNRSEIPHWPTESSTGWCTTRIASRCVGTPCVKRKERRRKSECIGGPKAVEKTGERRPWKSQERFPLSHSFNNNKLDDRDHFQQNAKTSVASLRGLIGSSRNTDRHHSGMLIDFIGIPTPSQLGNCAKVLETLEERCQSGLMGRFAKPLYGLKPVPGVRIPPLRHSSFRQ